MLTTEQFYLLYGILIAVLVQVLYDFLSGVFESKLPKNKVLAKFFGGAITIAFVGLIIGLLQVL